jgi:hypothetical protein
MRMNTPAVVNPRVRVIPAKVETNSDGGNPEGQKKKIAVYARVSTFEEEQQSSQELQESYFKEMIAKNENWELYKIYADHGVTGTNTKKGRRAAIYPSAIHSPAVLLQPPIRSSSEIRQKNW